MGEISVEEEIADRLRAGSENLLTKKEALIASCLISDLTVGKIAKKLCRSKNTIKIHMMNIKRKCHCKTQAKLGAILQGFLKNSLKVYILKAH